MKRSRENLHDCSSDILKKQKEDPTTYTYTYTYNDQLPNPEHIVHISHPIGSPRATEPTSLGLSGIRYTILQLPKQSPMVSILNSTGAGNLDSIFDDKPTYNKRALKSNGECTSPYVCCIHDNDKSICSIYDCTGLHTPKRNTARSNIKRKRQ
jgi:hypothetical protein